MLRRYSPPTSNSALGIVMRLFLGFGVQPGITSVPALLEFAIYAIWFLNLSIMAFQLLPIQYHCWLSCNIQRIKPRAEGKGHGGGIFGSRLDRQTL